MTMPTSTARAAALVLSTAALLAACNRTDDGRTAGQRVDAAVAATESKAKEAASQARQAAGEATDAVQNKTRDVAITAEVNARLARDDKLSALRINVDTADGRVVLRGSAPDEASRLRATDLARGVDGVVAVSNELTVQPRAS